MLSDISRMRIFYPLCAALGVLAVGAAAWGYTVDDAYIVGRFARNLAVGAGYGLNPGVPADGLTGPLWVLPGLLAVAIGRDPVATAKIVGLLCAACAAFLAVHGVRQRAGGRRAAPVAMALLLASPSLGTWGVAGLETGAAALLVTLAHRGASRRPAPSPLRCGLSIAGLAWLRPELALLALVVLALLWRRLPRAAWLGWGLAGLGAASVVGFRLASFGHALPLSFYAKAGDLSHGATYAAQAALLATSGVGLWLAYLGARSGRLDDLLTGMGLTVHLVAVALAGGDWMPGYRLLTPVLPLYAALAATGASRLGARYPRRAALALLLTCALPLTDAATRLPQLPATAASQARVAVEVGGFLREHATSVALVDVGILPYSSGVHVVDLGGITDEEIARLPGGHLDKRVPEALLVERGPDMLLLHARRPPSIDGQGRLRTLAGFPVERRVARMPWVRERFVVVRVFTYRAGYYYVALARSQEAPAEHE